MSEMGDREKAALLRREADRFELLHEVLHAHHNEWFGSNERGKASLLRECATKLAASKPALPQCIDCGWEIHLVAGIGGWITECSHSDLHTAGPKRCSKEEAVAAYKYLADAVRFYEENTKAL